MAKMKRKKDKMPTSAKGTQAPLGWSRKIRLFVATSAGVFVAYSSRLHIRDGLEHAAMLVSHLVRELLELAERLLGFSDLGNPPLR